MRTLILTLVLALLVVPVQAQSINATIAWTDNSTNEDGFRLERKVDAGAYATFTTTGPNVTQASDAGLVLNSTYCYRVAAFNAFGGSAFSNEACVTPTTPNAPSGLVITVTVVP